MAGGVHRSGTESVLTQLRARAHVLRRHQAQEARARYALSIIIPAYNEQLALEDAVERVVRINYLSSA